MATDKDFKELLRLADIGRKVEALIKGEKKAPTAGKKGPGRPKGSKNKAKDGEGEGTVVEQPAGTDMGAVADQPDEGDEE